MIFEMTFRSCSLKLTIIWLCWTFSRSDVEAASTVRKRSLADNIQSGIKFAGKILGKTLFLLLKAEKRPKFV